MRNPSVLVIVSLLLGLVSPSAIAHHHLPSGELSNVIGRRSPKPAGARGGSCETRGSQPNAAPPQETVILLPTQDVPYLSSTEHPTFYFYLPQSSGELEKIEFNLDYPSEHPDHGQEKLMQATNLPLPSSKGVVPMAVELPKGLKKGDPYQWQIVMYCKTSTAVIPFQGLLSPQSLSSDARMHLAPATSQEQAGIYRQEKFWLEAIDLQIKGTPLQNKSLSEVLEMINLQ
jgi:Domain of Unknown Function (DUF928)